jgi:hypothetical protein
VSSADLGFRPPSWEADYDKHYPDYSVSWKQILRTTRGLEGVARYHPSLSLADIERTEIETVSLGLGVEIVEKQQPHKRVFWRRMAATVGASNGRETDLIYVEYGRQGNVHGRPITEAELRRKGVKL